MTVEHAEPYIYIIHIRVRQMRLISIIGLLLNRGLSRLIDI